MGGGGVVAGKSSVSSSRDRARAQAWPDRRFFILCFVFVVSHYVSSVLVVLFVCVFSSFVLDMYICFVLQCFVFALFFVTLFSCVCIFPRSW